jgi:hypothetical protein
MDPKKVRRYGSLFGTIDFTLNPNLTEQNFVEERKKAIVGHFKIGNKEFPVTASELDRISETCETALTVLSKKHKLGRLR